MTTFSHRHCVSGLSGPERVFLCGGLHTSARFPVCPRKRVDVDAAEYRIQTPEYSRDTKNIRRGVHKELS